MHIVQYKGYDIKPQVNLPMSYIIVTSGRGGKIPDVMSGLFTHPSICKAEIDKYLANKPTKDELSDKAIEQSGS